MTENWQISKNILDLEHNEQLSKALTLLSISLGGLPTILFSLHIKNGLLNWGQIFVAIIFSLIFLKAAMNKFDKCKLIRDEIKRLREPQ